MQLQNDFLSLEFDTRTGSLIRLDDVKLGVNHLLAPAEGRLFKLTVPDDKRNFNRHCDNRYSQCPPRLQRVDDTVTITYDSLNTEEGDSLSIKVVARISLPSGSEEALFEIEVENNSGDLIHEVQYPYIGGWRGDTRPGKTTLLLADWPIDVHSLRHTTDNGFGKLHRRRYCNQPIPCMDISGDGRGISYICRAQTPGVGGFYLEDANERKGDMRFVWCWVFRPFIAKEAQWKSDSVAISTHNGDWHRTADRTREWLRTWLNPAPMPAGLKSSMGLFMIQYHEFCGGAVLNSPDVILRNAAYCREHGLDHILIWDPVLEHYLRPFNGEMCEFQDKREQDELTGMIHGIRKQGMHVSAFMDFRTLNLASETARRFLDRWSMTGLYGVPLRESYSWHQHNGDIRSPELDLDGRRICQKNPEYQEWVLGRVRKFLEIGFDSLAFDEANEPWCCFSPDHGHPVPMAGEEAAFELMGKVAELVRNTNPDAIILGEAPRLWSTSIIPMNFCWGWKLSPIVPFRYILPDMLVIVPYDPYEDDDSVLIRAFVLGCQVAVRVQGSEKPLSDVPALADRLKRLAELRERTASFTVEGRFLDTSGLDLGVKGGILGAVYAAEGKVGVILGDCSEGEEDGGREVSLKMELAALGKEAPRSVSLHRESGEVSSLEFSLKERCLHVSLTLRKGECAVLGME